MSWKSKKCDSVLSFPFWFGFVLIGTGNLTASDVRANPFDPNEMIHETLKSPAPECQVEKIVNGVVTKGYKPVVLVQLGTKSSIAFGCTGTITLDHIVLLSAHCFCATELIRDPDHPVVPDFFELKINGIVIKNPKIKIHRQYRPCSSAVAGDAKYDLAMIKLPDEKELPRELKELGSFGVSRESLEDNSEFTLIGYGANVTKDFKVAEKKVGTNKAIQYASSKISILGWDKVEQHWSWSDLSMVDSPSGKEVVAEHGDSGGPLLQGNKIFGVLSRYGYPTGVGSHYRDSVYTPLNTIENIDFLKEAQDWR